MTELEKKQIAMDYFRNEVGLEKEKLKMYAPQLVETAMSWWIEESKKNPQDMNTQDTMDLMVLCVVVGATYINQINEATSSSQHTQVDQNDEELA